ncbi:MAG TPA: MFS transporter [Steroidobacteraceae bacterium]|jgi:maltose/moltooligosaccharide transporter
MREKPALRFWQIWNMSFGFLGIQVGFALQNANMSRIFQTLGASIDDVAVLWLAAPVTGLLVQPVIGHFSDRTWGRLGRRRPYFLAGAILATAALVAMPNSSALWIAAGLLWMLDASINVSMEPFRALVGDMLPDRQRSFGFAMQSLFIGIGAVAASALPWILANWAGVANVAAEGHIPDSVRWAFYIGAIAFIVAVGWTVATTREYPPAEFAEFHARHETGSIAPPEVSRSAWQYRAWGTAWIIVGSFFSIAVALFGWDRQLHVLGFGCAVFGLLQLAAAWLQSWGRTADALYCIMNDFFLMPRTMRRLALVQFLSWFGLFAMWIYTTPSVAGRHFGATDAASAAYNDGANWVGVLFAAYNGFAAIAALLIPLVARVIGRRWTHLVNLSLGGLGLISFLFIDDARMLLVAMAGVGIAWASILSLPYAMLSGAVPPAKMGIYMGIFNFFIVIPQILAASVLGLLVRVVFGGESIYALVTGGVLMIFAGIATLRVDDGEATPR